MAVSVHLVQHPVLDDSLAVIRNKHTSNTDFRAHLTRIAMLTIGEATRHLPTERTTIETPLAETTVSRLSPQPVIVPVLRAGLGFVAAAQQLLPDADVGFVGMARNETTFEPEAYVTRLPVDIATRPVLVVDPMLATGGSLIAALALIAERRRTSDNPGPILVTCALAAPEGIARVEQAGFEIELFVAAIDEQLNDDAFIVPGLGDAGDRLFGPGA